MADYKDIVGTAVRNNAGDLTSAKTGELFYDSTNLNFIYKNPNVTSAGAWRTGGNLNTARTYQGAAGASSEAFITFGNYPRQAITELWNGVSWTEVNDLNENKGLISGAGTSTAAITSGGNADPGKSLRIR